MECILNNKPVLYECQPIWMTIHHQMPGHERSFVCFHCGQLKLNWIGSLCIFSQLQHDSYHLAVECILNENPGVDITQCPATEELLLLVTRHFIPRVDRGLVFFYSLIFFFLFFFFFFGSFFSFFLGSHHSNWIWMPPPGKQILSEISNIFWIH